MAYLCALVAVIFFGSNFVPVKKYETSDGVFFQFVMCLGIFVTGSIVNAIQGFPDFEPFAMVGGFLWCTGNMLSVPVIKMIGLSLGLLIWGTTNMLMGWASGTFGFFGLDKNVPDHPALNYAGVGVAMTALFMYTLIRTSKSEDKETSEAIRVNLLAKNQRAEEGTAGGENEGIDRMYDHYMRNDHASLSSATPRLVGVDPYMKKSRSHGNRLCQLSEETSQVEGRNASVGTLDLVDDEEPTFVDRLPNSQKRILGVVMAGVAGILFGSNFDPPTWLSDHGHTTDMLDYVYSHFCGIFLTSTMYFLIYCAWKKEPIINRELILPGFLSGVMWAIADTCWFYANSKLSMRVAFPIITSGPGFVAAMWGMIVFGENQGRHNQIVIGIAFVLTVASDLMIGLSSPP